MSQDDRILVELTRADRWADLSPEERTRFDRWLSGQDGIRPRGADLFMLLRFTRADQQRADRRIRRSSSTTLRAVQDTTPETDE